MKDESGNSIEVELKRYKYHDPEYDDKTIDSLMNYLDTYQQLQEYLENSHIPVFN